MKKTLQNEVHSVTQNKDDQKNIKEDKDKVNKTLLVWNETWTKWCNKF